MDTNGQPMTDDAELAKVLEGMQDATAAVAPSPADASAPAGLSFEPSVAPAVPVEPLPAVAPPASTLPPVADPIAPVIPTVTSPAPTSDPGLESIKRDALSQLRPLVDKLDLEPDEKFDTLLLIIRSTDDKSLVQSAYDAAKNIADDAKRAEALLDIVKEIDYFNNPSAGQPQL